MHSTSPAPPSLARQGRNQLHDLPLPDATSGDGARCSLPQWRRLGTLKLSITPFLWRAHGGVQRDTTSQRAQHCSCRAETICGCCHARVAHAWYSSVDAITGAGLFVAPFRKFVVYSVCPSRERPARLRLAVV